jgi:hypothetical protein
MTLHVDLFRTDWSAHAYRRVAVFELNGEGVKVVGAEADAWRDRLVHPITDPFSHQQLDPESAPKDWLQALVGAVQSPYAFAVGPHDDVDCPYTDVTPMEQVLIPTQPF